MNQEKLNIMKNKEGFIAALDQSGGSSAKTLKNYGILESDYNTDEEMFDLIHEMRTRVMTSKSFTNEKILGVILFEETMNRKILNKLKIENEYQKDENKIKESGNSIIYVIENNKIALDAIDESYRNLAEEARLKNDFFTEQWAMTSGTLHSCRVDLLTQYSLLLTMVSLLEEAVNTLCRLYHNINHLDKEVKDIKGSGLERAAKYLKDVVEYSGRF